MVCECSCLVISQLFFATLASPRVHCVYSQCSTTHEVQSCRVLSYLCSIVFISCMFFFFQAEDGIRDKLVTEFRRVLFRSQFYRFTPGAPTPLPGGTYTVGLGQTYPSLSEAVATLNHGGISGPVTLQLTDAVYDTTASGGNNVFPILLSSVPGSSASNTITIQPLTGTATLRHRGTESGNCGNQALTSVIGIANEPILGLGG